MVGSGGIDYVWNRSNFCALDQGLGTGFSMGWNQDPPQILLITVIQDWIFDYPTTAGSRALMIGIALGTVGTSFRIILGMERSFLGE